MRPGAVFVMALAAITALGALIRFTALDSLAPSIDEGWSVGAALGDVPHLLAVVSRDTHPPLYFLLQWVQVQSLGPMLAWDRTIAAAFGTLLVPLTIALAREVVDARSALLAGLLMAVSPIGLFYSRDARPHIMAAALTVLALLLLLRASRRSTAVSLVSCGLACAAAVLSSYPTVVPLTAAAAVLWWRGAFRRSSAWLAPGAFAAACLPWAVVALPHFGQARAILFGDRGLGSWERLGEFFRVSLYTLTGGFSLADVVLPAATLLAAGALLQGLDLPHRRPASDRASNAVDGDTTRLALVAAAASLLLFYALTSFAGGQFVARYLLPIVALVALGYVAVLGRAQGARWWAAAALLVVGWSWTAPEVLVAGKAHQDASELAAYLSSHTSPTDVIVFDWFSTRGQVVALNPSLRHSSVEGGYALGEDQSRATAQGGRLWLIADNTLADRQDMLRALGPGREQRIAGRTVLLFGG